MIDTENFGGRWNSFDSGHMQHFNNFWKRKLEIEENHTRHILDKYNLDRTCQKLWEILNKWQAYRPYGADKRGFKQALEKISESYDIIRSYDLKEIEEVSRKHLKRIWVELGKVKSGNESDSQYAVSACKPLMLLWGQTLGFDSNIRRNIPYPIKSKSKLRFDKWESILLDISQKLNQEIKVSNFLKEWSQEVFGKSEIVPYGRLLDIYFYSGS